MYALDGVGEFTYKDATVYDMYIEGYTNRLIHMPENKTYPDVEFYEGDGYSLVPVNELASKINNFSDYYNKIKGDKNGNVVVFSSDTHLEGLILRADAGHVFLTGFPKIATAYTADVLATVYMDIGGTKYGYNIKFANSNQGIKTWPNDANYVVSHGYATVKESARDKYYALGCGADATQKISKGGTLSTWYPGKGGILIFPFIATIGNNSEGTYYLFTSTEKLEKPTNKHSSKSYPSTFPYKSPEFTLAHAGATLTDGGLLNLTLSVGQSYTIFEALSGTFPHLRGAPRYTCVETDRAQDWGKLKENGVVSIEEITETYGNKTEILGKVTALKAGTTEATDYITFTATNSNCTYWGRQNSNPAPTFTVRVKITVVGGISYEVGDDGEATVETEPGSTVYVQRYDKENDKWEILALYENDSDLTSAGKTSGVDAVIVSKVNADFTDGNESFKVKNEAGISITGLAPGWAYRLVKENSGVYTTSAFFNLPEKPIAIAEVDKANEEIGSITITQKYGAYNETYVEEYRLQILKDDGNPEEPNDWEYVDSPWTSATGENTEVVFKNLDSSKIYRVVSRMKEDTIAKVDDKYNKSDTVVASAVTYGNPLTFGDKQIVKGPAVLYIEAGIDKDNIDLKTIYEVLCSEGDKCSDGKGFTPSELTFTTTDTDSKVATLNEEGQLTLGTEYGNLNIMAVAAATDTHSSGELDLEVVVIPKFSVSLTPDKTDGNRITLKPDYYDLNTWLKENGNSVITEPNTEESRFLLDNDSPKMQYREKGGTEWKPISADKWNWEKGLTLDYENLKPNTEYEVQITASNGKGTWASDAITFKTPVAKDSGQTGDGTIKVEVGIESDNLNDPDLEKGFTVILKNGDDIILVEKGSANKQVDQKTIIGTIDFAELPSGDYTVEVLYHHSKQTTAVAVTKDDKNPTVTVTFDGYIKKTNVKYVNNTKTIITVRGLYNMYSGNLATKKNKGITATDLKTIEAEGQEGSALIELIVEDVDENTSNGIEERMTAIKNIKTLAGNQRIAKLVDLTLEKTITPNNAIPNSSQTTPLIESNNYLDINIQTGQIKGRNIRVLRVHDADKTERDLGAAVAQVIPQAVKSGSGDLVWANNYTATDNCNAGDLTKDQKVSATSEYFILNPDSITLHVKKFSLYAVVYTVGSSSGSSSGAGSANDTTSKNGAGYNITPRSKDGSFIGEKLLLVLILVMKMT